MFYFVKTPWWLKRLYPGCIWNKTRGTRRLYLSFDDGPHPEITPYVLEELSRYNAHATFFCIGKNVVRYPGVYQKIIEQGHSVGNHTMNHLNGWKTPEKDYLKDVEEAGHYIGSRLFRPPYGRATRNQIKQLQTGKEQMKIIMWSLLSGDFDLKVSKQDCLQNVIQNAKGGDIIVFHDSAKAAEKLRYALPGVLQHFSTNGYTFENIQI